MALSALLPQASVLLRALLCAVFVAVSMPSSPAHAGRVLKMEFYVAETGFDPVKVQDLYSQTVCEAIFDSLMTYDYLARPAKLVPRLAEAMPTISDNAKTYVFKIRKGGNFDLGARKWLSTASPARLL